MISMKIIGRLVAVGTTALLAIAAVSAPALAQDDGGLLQVAEVKVKADRTQDFIALQQQMAEAGRAAGRTGRNVWQVVHGATNTFHIVEPRANMAAFDEGPDFAMSESDTAEWISSIVGTIDTRTVLTLRVYPDLDIPVADGYEENLIRLRIRTVKPGMNREYEAWVKDDLLPELRKGGQTGTAWYKIVTGGSGNTWYSITRRENFAAFGTGGALSHMEPDEIRAMLDKSSAMQTGNNEDLVIRYRADMSY